MLVTGLFLQHLLFFGGEGGFDFAPFILEVSDGYTVGGGEGGGGVG